MISHRPLWLLIFAACASAAPFARLPEDCVPRVESPKPFSLFPEQFHVISASVTKEQGSTKVNFAKDFTVEYFADSNYKLVTNNKANETYLLYQCTYPATTPPALATLPERARGVKFFEIPLSSITAADTTVFGFMEDLDLLNRVSYASPFSVNPCMQQLAGCDRAYNASSVEQKNAMLPTFSSSKNNASNVIAFTATSDPGPLKRAEWVKFLAVFFNKELEANAVFAAVNKSYVELKSAVQAVSNTVVASSGGTPPAKPLVANIYWFPSRQTVHLTTPTYKVELTQDAGGATLDLTLLLTKYAGNPAVVFNPWNSPAPLTEMSINMTMEGGPAVLREILQDVDVVVDETYNPDNRALYTMAQFTVNFGLTEGKDAEEFKFLRNGKVYRQDATVSVSGTDWFERAVSRPDWVLTDMVLMLTPAAAPKDAKVRFIRSIAPQANVSPVILLENSCAVKQCAQTPKAICPYAYRDCTTGELKAATIEQRCAPQCTAAPINATNTTRNSAAALSSALVMALYSMLAAAALMLTLL